MILDEAMETTQLLPVVAATDENAASSGRLRLRAWGTFFSAVAFLTIGASTILRPPVVDPSRVPATLDWELESTGNYSSDALNQMKEVYEDLLHGGHYKIYCRDTTYMLCGEASCKPSGTAGIAACGCEVIHEGLSDFSLDFASLNLIRSATFREAVLLSKKGDVPEATSKFCASLKDGSLWSEAGYIATERGSYHKTTVEGTLNGIVNGEALEEHGLHSSCMGSPCLKDVTWNKESKCTATCLCPSYSISGEDDTDDDGCFRNTIGNATIIKDMPYLKSLVSLQNFISALSAEQRTYSETALKASGSCSECTVK